MKPYIFFTICVYKIWKFHKIYLHGQKVNILAGVMQATLTGKE